MTVAINVGDIDHNVVATKIQELQTVNSAVPGTVTASKAVIADANKDVGTLRNVRMTRLVLGCTATSDNTVGNRTWTAAEILGGIIVRDTNGASRTDPLPTAQALVQALPGAAVGDVIECLMVNGADAAETITLTAGAGGGFDANQTAASRIIGQNASKMLTFRLTNVTPSAEAYVVYM